MIIVKLVWGWSAFARRLVLLAGLCLAAAFAVHRPALAVIAAAPLAWLALAIRRPEPGTAIVGVSQPERCFEHDPVTVTVSVELATAPEFLEVGFEPGPGFRLLDGGIDATTVDGAAAELVAELIAPRWGRHGVGVVRIRAWQRRRLRTAAAVVHTQTEVSVFPRPIPLDRTPVGSTRFDRAGEHPAGAAGAGVEFHSVRPFVAGDRPRRINWPASTRHRALHVNAQRAERSVDLVVAVDVLTDAGPPGLSSRDLALRGACGVARAALHTHDRVGLVALGGRLSWLRPETGERQFFRVADAILTVIDWASYVDPDVESIPYPALPAGAHILLFSPLLDERGIEAAIILRRRGHPTTVLDVCTAEPVPAPGPDELALRLWRLDRTATRHRLAEWGITVVSWDGTAALGPLVAGSVRPTERVPR